MEFQIDRGDLMAFLKNRTNQIKSEKDFIHSKIDSWLTLVENGLSSTIEKKQKEKELIDLGKFILCFNESIEIVDAICESPDFLISLDKKQIGIELADVIIRSDEKQKEGTLKKIFTYVETELTKEPNKYNGIYRVSFPEKLELNSNNKNKIQIELLELIKTSQSAGTVISNIRKTPHTNVSIYHSEAFVVGSLQRITIENILNKKETKVSNYVSDKFEEIWLLMVLGGVQTSSDYSFIEESITNSPFNTSFDKVFLLNFFTSDFFELITTKP